jgi:hypothetical protein
VFAKPTPAISAASAIQTGWFETKWLCRLQNLAHAVGQPVGKTHQRRPPKMIALTSI